MHCCDLREGWLWEDPKGAPGAWGASLLALHALISLSQVAIIAGNFELAEVIKTHKDSDVGEFCPPMDPF